LAVLKAVMNLRVLYNVRSFFTSWRPVDFSGRTLLHTCT